MTDSILLIHADSAGDPAEPGTVGHFVLVSEYPAPPFNEFDDNGHFEHADCGPAAILSALAARGQHPTATAVEAACGTTGSGTTVKGVSTGLGHFGVVNTWQQRNPAPGWIMNPAGGRTVPPSEFPAYLAASQGWTVTFASVVPPDPPPPTSSGEPLVFIYQRTNGSIFLCTGTTNIGFGDGADVTYFEGLGYKIAYENHMTIAFAAKLNALPVI